MLEACIFDIGTMSEVEAFEDKLYFAHLHQLYGLIQYRTMSVHLLTVLQPILPAKLLRDLAIRSNNHVVEKMLLCLKIKLIECMLSVEDRQ